MSRIGKKPISVPDGVKVELSGGVIKIGGPKGNLHWAFPSLVSVAHNAGDKVIEVARGSDEKRARAMHGTARALIQNMVTGVSQGYTVGMEVYGTGYSVNVDGKTLVLNVGFAHVVRMPIPAGVEVKVETPNTRGNDVPAKFSITGPDKQVVGQLTRSIKDVRPPEPYQGKGVRFAGERIIRKQGKAFAGGG
jgi:large subunit ribosomal protein L6